MHGEDNADLRPQIRSLRPMFNDEWLFSWMLRWSTVDIIVIDYYYLLRVALVVGDGGRQVAVMGWLHAFRKIVAPGRELV